MMSRLCICLAAILAAAGGAQAVDGIAVSSHRAGGGDIGVGVARSIFGDIVRHDIKNNKVVKSTVIYRGKARGARINHDGDKVAFLKLDGHICVMDMAGRNLKELTNTKNRNASAIDWPLGDWVYYTEEGSAPDGQWGAREKADTPEKKTIRRVNVVTGADERVGMTPYKVWQMSLAAHTDHKSGRFAITGMLLDMANPGVKLNSRGMNCGNSISASGRYVTEMGHTHADVMIWNWDLSEKFAEFHVNEWNDVDNDQRKHFYRPRWSVNSDKWVIVTNGEDFGATSRTNMVIYNWMDEQQIQVTRNRGRFCDEGEDFWVAGMASDFVAGGMEGEAPFTVNLRSAKLKGRKWNWDFGDRTKSVGSTGKHTYTKPGLYKITAKSTGTGKDGNKTLRQHVTVGPRRAPRGKVTFLDAKHLMVTFDEPVVAKRATAAIGSKTMRGSCRLDPTGRKLLVTFRKTIPRADTLRLGGITDLAQQPNELANPKIAFKQPAWPGNRKGLLFLWDNNKDPCVYFDAGADSFRTFGLATAGPVKFDRTGVMSLEGGVALAANNGTGIVRRCKVDNKLTLEATIKPAIDRQGSGGAPARIIVLRPDQYLAWNNGFFALHQEGENLLFYLSNKGQRFDLGPLPIDKPSHVVISYAGDKLTYYVNGKKARHFETAQKLNWGKRGSGYQAGVHFGGFTVAVGGQTRWRGTVEGVAIYNRALEAAEVASNATAAGTVKAAKAVPQISVRATLVATTKAPTPAQMTPYRDALIVHEYEVEKLVKGKYKAKKLRVAHWGVRDLKKTRVAYMKVGTGVFLVVEPFGDHPELEGQFIRDALPSDFDLTLQFEVKMRKTRAGTRITADPAKGRLGLAKSYLAAGMLDKATKILQDIIKKHPKTDSAKKARELLKKARSKD